MSFQTIDSKQLLNEKKNKSKNKFVIESTTSIQLNERFRQIFAHIDLKRFKHFNKIQQ